MNIQLVTLLATLVAVISNLLAINEKFSKFGIIGTTKILSLYVLPVIFIQQILQVVYNFEFSLSMVFSVLPILLIIYLIVKRLKGKSLRLKEELLIAIILLSTIFFIVHTVKLKCNFTEYGNDIKVFIQHLSCYKISGKMYLFLSHNLLYVFYIITDAISIILFMIVEIETVKYFNCHYLNLCCYNDDDKPECVYLVVHSMALFLTTSGLMHLAVRYIINLFE